MTLLVQLLLVGLRGLRRLGDREGRVMQKKWLADYLAGKSIKAIAKEAKTSFSIVYRALIKMEAKFRPRGRPSKIDSKTACAMYLSGMSLRAIGKELGVTHVAVVYHLKKAGIYVRRENALAQH